MTSRLQDLLSTRKGRSELDRQISDLLRSQDFTEAEQYLTAELRTHPSHITDVCLALPADVIAIEGWDELNAEIERLDATPSGPGAGSAIASSDGPSSNTLNCKISCSCEYTTR